MKLPHLPVSGLLAACALLLAAPAARAEAAPAYPLREALALAEKVLASHNAPDVFIQRIELGKPALFSERQRWIVTWSRPLPASKAQSREIGLAIDMDGRAVRVVKESGR